MVSLLIATIATAVALNKTCDSRYDWWQGTVLYHINVSEFHNSDGNNIGDLRGVEERVDYFKYLGVHAVILNNFIQAMHPFWDKITSYTAIDSRIGTMEVNLGFFPNRWRSLERIKTTNCPGSLQLNYALLSLIIFLSI